MIRNNKKGKNITTTFAANNCMVALLDLIKKQNLSGVTEPLLLHSNTQQRFYKTTDNYVSDVLKGF